MRRILLFSLGLLALVVMATPASAQGDYTQSSVVTVSDPTPNPCDTITISGSGFEAGEEVPILINGVLVGTAVANASGDFTFLYTIPCDTVGTLELTISSHLLTLEVQSVTSTTTPTGALPTTGSDATLPFARLGVVLAAGGGILLASTRRRREHAAA